MDARQTPDSEQAALWNGPAGNAWVDEQAVLDQVLKPFEAMLLDTVSAGSGQHVLDVGCGTGATTLALARRLGAQGQCIGIDISGPMIAVARARAEREASQASFIQADAQAYRFAPASFDRIVSRFGVMFFGDPVVAFASLRRAAKEGAELHCIAWRSGAENPFMTTAERAAAPLLPLPVRQPGAPGQFALADRDRVAALLEEAGWSGIEIRPIDVACTLPEPALVGYFTRLGPVGVALLQADASTRAQVIDTLRVAFEPYVHGNEVRFTAACWMICARAASDSAEIDHA
ncbi:MULTISPECIES: class I SAM-dependent methyltransferase [Cupriavidus]|uniref:class I SAM-dependent methyltransferase n=1 Tax=Cupriavidus sp. DF5525 TaxID=3160989 RepID=UPI0003B0450B|nr:hypothetical protein N234_00135 [Ralstonia pickettii DTP0602]